MKEETCELCELREQSTTISLEDIEWKVCNECANLSYIEEED